MVHTCGPLSVATCFITFSLLLITIVLLVKGVTENGLTESGTYKFQPKKPALGPVCLHGAAPRPGPCMNCVTSAILHCLRCKLIVCFARRS